MSDAVRFADLVVRIGGVSILEGVTARVPAGSCTAVVGPNGAGKTTLLRALLGEVPHAGAITLTPRADGRRPRIGYVPQRLAFDRALPLTVREALAMGWTDRPLWLGIARALRARAEALLAEVEAAHLVDRPLGALSGGELQRVLLAMALGRDPDLLVLDEPASGVDVVGEQLICEMAEQARRRRGFTQLMVSHDLGVVAAHAQHVICLNRRCLAEGAPTAALTGAALQATFGRHLGIPDPHDLGTGALERACRHDHGPHGHGGHVHA